MGARRVIAPRPAYRAIVERLRQTQTPYRDEARAFQPTAWPLRATPGALSASDGGSKSGDKQGSRGVVVLPTGTGKTFWPSWPSITPPGRRWS